MVFASPVFLFIFMPVTLVLYWLVPMRMKNFFLLAASLLFYAWGEPVYVLLMIFSILSNFFLTRVMAAKRRRIIFIGTVALNLGMLVVFKYANFLVSTINAIFQSEVFSEPQIKLPLGISFYTFQILSYVIDVWRGNVPVQENIIDFSTYVTMFPQLIAGPIVRYSDVSAQLHSRELCPEEMAGGARRFCVGLAKKVLIANIVAEVADSAFRLPVASMHFTAAWVGIFAYAIQIYFDFSGYSDMAIGLGAMLGFHFNENFNYPYISCSLREFWRRWHISLSGWFRDYLYIPLGGSRCGKIRTYCNLLIVFMLCGLWHGASWNFVVWGLFHGIFLVLERQQPVRKLLDKLPKPLTWLYAMVVVGVSWVFFRADSIPAALYYIDAMFSSQGNITALALVSKRSLLPLVFGAVASFPVLPWFKRKRMAQTLVAEVMTTLICLVLFLFSALLLAGGTYNPFIYSRF